MLWLFNFRWVGVGNFFIYCARHTPDLFQTGDKCSLISEILYFPALLYIPSKIPSSHYYIPKIYLSKHLKFFIHTTISVAIFLQDFSWFYLLAHLLLIFLQSYFLFPLGVPNCSVWICFFTASHYVLMPCFLLYNGNIQIIISDNFFKF